MTLAWQFCVHRWANHLLVISLTDDKPRDVWLKTDQKVGYYRTSECTTPFSNSEIEHRLLSIFSYCKQMRRNQILVDRKRLNSLLHENRKAYFWVILPRTSCVAGFKAFISMLRTNALTTSGLGLRPESTVEKWFKSCYQIVMWKWLDEDLGGTSA